MSLLVIGLSHHSAPLGLLEQVAAAPLGLLAERVTASESVSETVLLSTCNRLEVYAEAVTFHGAVSAIGEALAATTGVDRGELTSHLFVHFEDRAVAHAFSVASGLDSMAVGEVQILGQLRAALHQAQHQGTLGESLNSLLQQALRVGKRAHRETGIDEVSRSLVEVALDEAGRVLGPLSQRDVLVVGAGGMSSLAATTTARRGTSALTIVNRTDAKARRLAELTAARSAPMSHLQRALEAADVVLSSTGAAGHLVEVEHVMRAQEARGGRPQVYLDLALPRDVAPEVAELPGVTLVSLAELGPILSSRSGLAAQQVQSVRDLVTGEVADYLTGRMAKTAAPTVVALRERAATVVDGELVRLDQKLPALDEATRAEVHRTVRRVVDKLLHTPTVRIKELTGEGHGEDYVAALRELFDLDPHVVAAVSSPPQAAMFAEVAELGERDAGGER